jgi:RNA polymerase sigma-54 factor
MLGIQNQLVEAIIQDHMKDLEIKNYNHISRKNKVPCDDVFQAVMIISNMDPRPGSVIMKRKFRPLFLTFMSSSLVMIIKLF